MLPQTSKFISLFFLLLCLLSSSFAQDNANSSKFSENDVQTLVDTLKTKPNKNALMFAIGKIYEIASENVINTEAAASPLIEIIKTSKDKEVLPIALEALVSIAQKSQNTVQKLIEVLKTSEDNNTRNFAIQALGTVGEGAKEAIPYLIEIIKTNKDSDVLSSALGLLGSIGKEAKETIPLITEIIKTSKDDQVLPSAIESFLRIGETVDTIPFLVETLKTSNDERLKSAIESTPTYFAKNGKELTPFLIDTLKTNKDNYVLIFSVRVLGSFGVDARDAAPVLVDIFEANKNNKKLLFAVIDTLGVIGASSEDATRLLVETLKTSGDKDITLSTIVSLGKMKKGGKIAIPQLFALLKNDSALEPKQRFPLSDARSYNTIYIILEDLAINNDFSENKNIRESFELYKNNMKEVQRIKIDNAIDTLEQRESIQNSKWFNDIITKHPNYVWTAVTLLSLFIIWLVSFCVRPVWLVSIHEKLWLVPLLSALKIPALPLIPFICLRTRPLDAWVKKNSAKVKTSFQVKETVKERSLHIPVKVSFNGDRNTEFIAQNFQKVFTENKSDILIHGDGGSGKTSLVCRIAQWAMDGSLFNRHTALPVLIESNVKDIQKKINEEIKELTDSTDKISDALQKALLRKKRILLIVDGLSELDETTKQQIVNNTEINAVIYTSRNDEIKDIAKIETNNVADESLYHFISTYIEKFIENLAEKPQFQNNEIHEYCANLSKLVGEKGISVLLAKLYAEQLVAEKEGTIGEALPKNIPELMLKSINVLHKKTPSDNIEFSDVIKALEIIAYECLRKDYRPLPAAKDKVKEALANAKISDDVFKHLRDKLKIIENKGTDESEIAFKIDPLAEYLAADYLVKENSYKADKWKAFLEDAKNNNVKNSIKGFLVAVKDCYEINKDVPPFVFEELTKLIESDKQSNEDKIN
jgi:HEAT repeat protein